MHSENSITESRSYSVIPFPIYQSLHYLRKRDKNSAENFVHGAKKAVMSRTMLRDIKKKFFEKAGPVVAYGLLTVAPFLTLFNGTARGGEAIAQTASTSASLQQQKPLLKYNFVGKKFKERAPDSTIPGMTMLMAEDGEIVVINFIHPGDPHSKMQTNALAQVLKEESARIAQTTPLQNGERFRTFRLLDVDAKVFERDFHVAYANNSMGPEATTMPVGPDGPLVPYGKISVDANVGDGRLGSLNRLDFSNLRYGDDPNIVQAQMGSIQDVVRKIVQRFAVIPNPAPQNDSVAFNQQP